MKIAVIAANGRSGQAFVDAALAAGHQVNAGIRGKSYLQSHPQLTIMECDATSEEQLTKLIAGQDAVASFIGHVKGSAPNVQTEAIQKVIKVMNQLGVKRLVSLTGTGVRIPGDKITWLDKLMDVAIKVIDLARVRDGINHVEALKNSNLDWTVIRVLKLQNTKPSPFTLKEHGPTKLYVSRQDVAQAVLQVLQQNTFIKQAPIISKPT